MNTEIFDYFKAISKKENFFINFLCTCFSVAIIILGFISLLNGASVMLYTLMFGCATIVLWLNAFKFIKNGSKNGWVLAVMGLVLCAFTAMGVYTLMQ